MGSLADLYVSTGQVTGSSLVICNRTNTQKTFRLSIAVANAADDPKQYLYYDTIVAANDTFIATIGITLANTDVVRCYGDSNLTFQLFGVVET